MKILNYLRRKKVFRKPDFEYNGHKYYVTSPTDTDGIGTPTARMMRFVVALNQLEININNNDLHAFQQQQEKYLEVGNIQQALFLNRLLKARLELKTYEAGWLELAKSIILIDDEVEPSPMYDKVKDEELKLEPVKFFFIKQALHAFSRLSTSSDISGTEDYLAQPKVKEVETMFQSEVSK